MSPGVPHDDVLVLGGGAVGLACALYLLRAGRSVRVLEQAAPGSGSSHGNCGTITPSHAPPLAAPGMLSQALRWMLQPDAPLYIRPRLDPQLAGWLLRFAARCNRRDWQRTTRMRALLLHAAHAELETLIGAERLDCGWDRRGLLYAFRQPAMLERVTGTLDALRELDIDSEVWDASRLAAEEPALRPGLAGGVLFPGDAQLRPERYVRGLADAVRAAGGIIETDCTVQALQCDERGIRAQTSAGPHHGRDAVLALGAWSPAFARGLELRLPIQPGKGYSITYSRPTRVPRRPLVLKERAVCVTAWDDGFRLGSTMEFAGYDRSLNRTRLDALVRGAREYLHEAEGPERLEEWYGWRPMTWDDLPIIGPAPRHARLWLATGHGMLGVTMSAITGRLLAEQMSGATPCLDPTPYRAERFG